MLGVSHHTVISVRDELRHNCAGGQLAHLHSCVGGDDKSYPSQSLSADIERAVPVNHERYTTPHPNSATSFAYSARAAFTRTASGAGRESLAGRADSCCRRHGVIAGWCDTPYQ
jgi:hypothetical protein